MFDIAGLFAKDAIVRYLKSLPVLKTPVMDSIFTDRPQLGLPVVGADMILETAHALPVVRRRTHRHAAARGEEDRGGHVRRVALRNPTMAGEAARRRV
jgi:hypothetical protein